MDLGCGTSILKKFLPANTYYIGLDFSLEMLKKSYRNYDNLNLIQADVEYLPFKDAIFTNIFLITVIQNLLDVDRLIDELMRISRKKCIFYLAVLKKDKSLLKFRKIMDEKMMILRKKIEIDELEDYLFIYTKNKC
ncbi:MAG: class I SAM-dependent methyltransferase [Candidatus Helarchaeota archaeon]